jgi:hypothetical protein
VPTHPSWRLAVAELRKATAGATREQRTLAAKAGLELSKRLPKLVAAARLKVAYASALCIDPVHPPADSQLEFLSGLNEKRARDSNVLADHLEAEAWINFYLLKRRKENLEKLQIEAGDIVQIEDSGGTRLEEVASIATDGLIYFRGGHGAREWPDRVTVKARGSDNSRKARALKKVTANQASARSTSREFSRVKELELRPYKVTARLTLEDIEQLRNVIDTAKDEKPIQSFLESRPQILAALVGGRSRFVVPRPNFGGKLIPDFLIADVDSGGINWVLVELETPASAVTLEGDHLLEKHARKGVSQVIEWRGWTENNLDLARKSRRDGGLGLPDISSRSRGLVLVGRRARLGDNASEVRRPVSDDQRIDVHTYDYLLDRLEGTLSFRGPSGLNPRLIQPWRDGDIVHAGTELGEVSSDVETAEPELDIRKPFTTGKPKGK